ncbi:MAG: hypothetical protein RW306_18455 [Geobacteraceae bacterium]|nr:hypothetical protein [Geobacteraceae bacterium]
MKKKLLPAISIGIAVLLIGSIAYAADRRKNAKNTGRPVDDIHEEELLQAELLRDLAPQDKKPVVSEDSKMIAAIISDDNKEASESDKTVSK